MIRKLSKIEKHPIMNKVWCRFYDNGETIMTEYPPTRQEAALNGLSKYCAGDECPTCGYERVRSTATGVCIKCQQLKINFIYWFKTHSFNQPFDQYMMLPKKQVDWTSELQPYIDEARNVGRLPSDKPCKHGHIHYKTATGKCNVCEEHNTPVLLAQYHGLSEYLPVRQCTGCRKKTFRYVETGVCTACNSSGHNNSIGASVTHSLMNDNPDMILSKTDAQSLGFKVYRTGKPCRNGHTGFRWVANSGCVECMKKG